MSEISAQLVKQLREQTGAGMMECKKALSEAGGNLEEAVVILRKRGLAAAGKKSTRVTKQGLILAKVDADAKNGVLVEVNCESDFVARTDDFQELGGKLTELIDANPELVNVPDAVAALMALPLEGATVADYIKQKIAKLGENISVARFTRYKTTGVIGSYIHPGAQLGVLIDLHGGKPESPEFQELVKDLAMQIAAADPKFLRREDVTNDILQKERDIQKGRVIAEGKPAQVADKIVEGRMGKFYEEVCLLEQPFIKENSTTIGELIKAKGAKMGAPITVERFTRYKVGETASAEAPAEPQA